MRYFTVFFLFLSHFASAFTPEKDGLYAVFDTSVGEFTIQLHYTSVPLTVGNFVGLAEGTIPRFDKDTGEVISSTPYYDGLIFHEVVANGFIQTGNPDPDDPEAYGPGYYIPDEMNPNFTHFETYAVSMYNLRCLQCWGLWEVAENSGGSQFFITLEPPPNTEPPGDLLDGYRSIFGRVIDGTDVVDAIGIVPIAEGSRPVEDVVINTVTILREGTEAEAFDITQLELPLQLSAEVGYNAEEEGFEFTTVPGVLYSINTSSDLENWTSTEEFTHEEASPIQRYVAPNESGATFIDIKGTVPPINYRGTLAGARFSIEMPNVIIGSKWTIEFSEDGTQADGFGSVEISGFEFGEPMYIVSYHYHRLPDGARIKIRSNNFHEIVFYLKFVDETTGGVFAWVDDYVSGGGNGVPLRYPSTGTFELIFPDEN